MRTRVWPKETSSPGTASMATTWPLTGASISFIIFMASKMHRVCPFSTCCPTLMKGSAPGRRAFVVDAYHRRCGPATPCSSSAGAAGAGAGCTAGAAVAAAAGSACAARLHLQGEVALAQPQGTQPGAGKLLHQFLDLFCLHRQSGIPPLHFTVVWPGPATPRLSQPGRRKILLNFKSIW